jgi:hypothetical protein
LFRHETRQVCAFRAWHGGLVFYREAGVDRPFHNIATPMIADKIEPAKIAILTAA